MKYGEKGRTTKVTEEIDQVLKNLYKIKIHAKLPNLDN